jgi:hypothetical protein
MKEQCDSGTMTGAGPSGWKRRSMTRRRCLKLAGLAAAGGLVPWNTRAASPGHKREYHVCLSPEAVLEDPEFPVMLSKAGVSCVWLAGFFYGFWPWPVGVLARGRDALLRAGLECRVVNVPLGHPGDSLGARDGSFPLAPPNHWRMGTTFDGKQYTGTSLHLPATTENAGALLDLRQAGFSQFFLDDDFRLARSPGEIGGCFCADHRKRFFRRTGFSSGRWDELLDDTRNRRLTPLLREWVEFTADDLTESFRAQQRVADGGLGIMVMYLGAEKAGIRLADYKGTPMRVGELMFNDSAFGSVKGKTDELFSALFHRRYVEPELAYSETTAYPANQLSAAHLAAKLAISTITDVRHTMFMSGVTPFPKGHWETLAPAMRQQVAFHQRLAGHRPRGPFKHYWGEASRYTGNDQPFSLFLATGIPFEVTNQPARDGWTFLSDADATAVNSGKLVSKGTRFICRPKGELFTSMEPCNENLEALFELKRSIVPTLLKTPFVENDEPAVLAWFPTARAAFLWNVSPMRKSFRVRYGDQTRELSLESLDSALVENLA